MKKKYLIAIYILWVSLLIYIFFRLIHPPVHDSHKIANTNEESPDQAPITWVQPDTNITFVRLPKGCFNMGSPLNEKSRGDDEGPVHKVCLDSFWISKTEISIEQFKVFIDKTDYQTQAEKEGFSWGYDGNWKKRTGLHWKNPGFLQENSHPVVHVTYNDVIEMARWLSGLRRRFSLPTEAQWEYACRAKTKHIRYFGDNYKNTCQFANVADKSIQKKYPAWTIHPCNDTFIYTAPVASLKPNNFGLFDMLGNVWEWCLDQYIHKAYLYPQKITSVKSKNNPVVIRGGSWYSRPQFVRCANRDYVGSFNRRSSDLGFRLVMNLRD